MTAAAIESASGSVADQHDLTGVVRLRKHIGHAAFSFQVIGCISWITLLYFWAAERRFTVALFVLLLILPGLVTSTAKGLRSGSFLAAGVIAVCTLPVIVIVANLSWQLRNAPAGNIYWVIGAGIVYVPIYFLIRGIIALACWLSTRRRNVDFKLLSYPWEDGLRVKRRPRFLHLLNAQVISLILVSALLVVLLVAFRFINEPNRASSIATHAGEVMASFLVLLIPATWVVRIYRQARRAAMLPGSALIKRDTRPFVLYLRSFQDDTDIKLRARASNGRILPEQLLKVPFEEVLCDHLWGYGPVLAIGNPQTKGTSLPLGAARDYASDSSWQYEAERLMQNASMIVAVAGKTQGLAWEIDKIINLGLLSKFVLILPPVNRRDMQDRLLLLTNHVPNLPIPLKLDLAHAHAITFPQQCAQQLISRDRSDWAYEAALDQAAMTILTNQTKDIVLGKSTEQLLTAVALKVWRTASQYFVSLFIFVVIASFALAYSGAELMRTEASHPFAQDGAERTGFLEGASKGCERRVQHLPGAERKKFCNCFTEELAAMITNGDINSISSFENEYKNSTEKEKVMARMSKTAYGKKSTTAFQVCAKRMQ